MLSRRLTLLVSFYIAFCWSSFSYAETRPKIGLVLGGGGAKGGAHIGVLKVLEENNIKVDYIAGTSIGAYVGGMYALGYSAEEIEVLMFNEDWDQGYSDDVAREDLRYRDKELRDTYNLQLNLGFKDGSVKAARGFLVGQSMNRILRNSTKSIHTFNSFDDLAIPYRAIATDLSTSEAVIIDSGNIIDAMQASASVPGAVQPLEIEGRLLVDGGIANNLPVDIVREMGADIIIAVDIGSALEASNQFTSTVQVLGQLSTILTNASTQRQIKLLTEQDIYIRPEIDDLSTTDWSDLPESLNRGLIAAKLLEQNIARLAVSNTEYDRYLAEKKQRSESWFRPLENSINEIVLDNRSSVNDALILKYFDLTLGRPLTESEITAAVDRVYALNYFERVETTFNNTETGRVLTLKIIEKSWGPNYFDFGINYQSDVSVNSVLSVDMDYKQTLLNEYGGEWRSSISLGFEESIATEFYQPLTAVGDYDARASIAYIKNRHQIETIDQTYFDLDKNYFTGTLALGYNFNNDWRLEFGLLGQTGRLNQKVAANNKFDFHQTGIYGELVFDDLDSISFPTKGGRFGIYIGNYQESYDDSLDPASSRSGLKIKMDWRAAVSFSHHTLIGSASFSSYDSDGTITVNTEQLGGFLNLSGYGKNTLNGPKKVFGAAIYQFDLGRDMLNMTTLPLYLGISAEAGNIWRLNEDIEFDELILASSVYIGTDTRFGPLALGVGVTDDNESSFFVSIGRYW